MLTISLINNYIYCLHKCVNCTRVYYFYLSVTIYLGGVIFIYFIYYLFHSVFTMIKAIHSEPECV